MLQWFADYLDAMKAGEPVPERKVAVFGKLG
jgi:hypothetical protein